MSKRLSEFGANTESLLNLMDCLQSAYELDGKRADCKNKAILVNTKRENVAIYALWKMRRLLGSKKLEEELLLSPTFFQ